MNQVLILCGGWDGHEPQLTSKRFAAMLKKHGYESVIAHSLSVLEDFDYIATFDLVVACWTMGEITDLQVDNLSKAVATGVGLAGCHGGMCDAFRNNVYWQFMCGGQWVSHPGGDGVLYRVEIHPGSSPITQGLSDFDVCSEHYYLHVDPAIEVLATTRFPVERYYHISNKPVDMPVAWTKFWGNGRVFYTSLGHHDDVFDKSPTAAVLMERGLLWAAQGKAYAIESGLTTAPFESEKKMY